MIIFKWMKKLCENVLIYNISYKTLIGAEAMHIRFDKVHGFIKVYDGTRYLKLFELGKCEIFNRIRHLTGVKVVLHMSFFIIMQESKLIHMILCYWKKC